MSYTKQDDDYLPNKNHVQYEEIKSSYKENSCFNMVKSVFLYIAFAISIALLIVVAATYSKYHDNKKLTLEEITLPTKFYIKDMTANQYQGSRATCWYVFSFL